MIVDQKINKQFVGVYLIDNGDLDGTQLATTTKPTRFKIIMTKWILGWKWMSILELKEAQERIKLSNKNAEAIINELNAK
jgi:hypothetical protein